MYGNTRKVLQSFAKTEAVLVQLLLALISSAQLPQANACGQRVAYLRKHKSEHDEKKKILTQV